MELSRALLYVPTKPEDYRRHLKSIIDTKLPFEEISRRIGKSVEWINGVFYRQDPYWSDLHETYDAGVTRCIKENWLHFSPEQLATSLNLTTEEVSRRYNAARTSTDRY